jgi:uncharacterized protein
VIYVDANIPMYVVGAAHPNKDAAHRLLAQAVRDEVRLVTSTEVFQEILHRYTAIGRSEAIAVAFGLLLDIVDEVYPVDLSDVERARDIVLSTSGLSARDALHLAVMEHHGIQRVMTFDAGFDGWAGVTRWVQ